MRGRERKVDAQSQTTDVRIWQHGVRFMRCAIYL